MVKKTLYLLPKKNMYNRKFYEAIGHAFYAVAHADKKVSKEEFQTLIKIVRDEWAPLENETDEFGEDIAFQIVAVFDWLSENDVKDKEAIHHFKNYVEEHPKLFHNEKIQKKILSTCEKIAEATHGINKKENVLKEIKSLIK